MTEWGFSEWRDFVLAFAVTLLMVELIVSGVRNRRIQKAARDYTPDGALLSKNGYVWTYWSQVGALDFRRYLENEGGRVELERVVYEDTPAGRLAAKDFFATHNVTGPKVLHTRDQGWR